MQLTPLDVDPGVSFVMPVLNEEGFLESAVRSVLTQDVSGERELILALGPSTDRSDDIARRLAEADPRIRLVENPERDIPIGLNLAIARSAYPIIVRVDAHSELAPSYTRDAVEILRRTGAANVGGVMRADGVGTVQRAIAAAYNSPFGLGGGAYHSEGAPGPAESAYLGVFRREAVAAVGGFDPSVRRGEDWELNLRIRRAGGLVWFDPRLSVIYRPRASLRDLARQFFATGAWRAELVRRYGRANPWRFFAPGLLVLSLAASLLLAILQGAGLVPLPWWSLVHLIPLWYVAAVAFGAAQLRGVRGARERSLGMLTLATMHLSWGSGFLAGLAGGAPHTLDRSRAGK